MCDPVRGGQGRVHRLPREPPAGRTMVGGRLWVLGGPGFGCCVAGEPEMEVKKRWGFSREVREEGRKGAESKRGRDRQEPQP